MPRFFILLINAAVVLNTAQALSSTDYSGCAHSAPEHTLQATPVNYRSMLNVLQPGDRLHMLFNDSFEPFASHNKSVITMLFIH